MTNEPDNDDFQEDDNLDSILDDFFPETAQTKEAAPTEEKETEAEPVQAEAEQEETAEEPEEKSPLSPLLAEKARQERELRQKLSEKEQALEQQVKAARDQLVQELVNNPQKFIRDYGIDNAGDLAAHFYAADLGDDAPPELRELTAQSELEKYKASVEARFAELELQRERAAIEARNQATIEQYNGYLANVPESLPYFAAEAAHDSGEALRTMAEVADYMYEQNGKYPSAAEVAQLIEKQISDTAARYQAIQKPNVEQTTSTVEAVKQEKPKSISQTLSTENEGGSHRTPTGEDELFEDAMKWLEENYKPMR